MQQRNRRDPLEYVAIGLAGIISIGAYYLGKQTLLPSQPSSSASSYESSPSPSVTTIASALEMMIMDTKNIRIVVCKNSTPQEKEAVRLLSTQISEYAQQQGKPSGVSWGYEGEHDSFIAAGRYFIVIGGGTTPYAQQFRSEQKQPPPRGMGSVSLHSLEGGKTSLVIESLPDDRGSCLALDVLTTFRARNLNGPKIVVWENNIGGVWRTSVTVYQK